MNYLAWIIFLLHLFGIPAYFIMALETKDDFERGCYLFMSAWYATLIILVVNFGSLNK